MTTDSIVVRPASREDLAAILTIENESFADPWDASSFVATLELSHMRVRVAEQGEGGERELLGYVVAMLLGDEAEIADLAVASAARRRGVGGFLLDHAMEETRRAGASVLFLEVRESNVAARALYESRAFSTVGRRRGYYRQPVEDALILKRDLAPT